MIANMVKEILRAAGWHLPRKFNRVLVAALVAIALLFPASYIAGVLSWSRVEACSVESQALPFFKIPNLPAMKVVHTAKGCVVMPLMSGVAEH